LRCCKEARIVSIRKISIEDIHSSALAYKALDAMTGVKCQPEGFHFTTLCTKYQPPLLCLLAAPASAISASTDQLYRTCPHQLSVPAFGISCVFRASAVSVSVNLLYSTSLHRPVVQYQPSLFQPPSASGTVLALTVPAVRDFVTSCISVWYQQYSTRHQYKVLSSVPGSATSHSCTV
jgi:hypothetical protein